MLICSTRYKWEKDTLISHGASRLIREKFCDHSDGYTEYRCRCGRAAIVNHKDNIYKCKFCKDNADIVSIPTSYSSKLFRQEMESLNVGIKAIPVPFTYEQADTSESSAYVPEVYNSKTIKETVRKIREFIDDGKVTAADD